MHSAQPPRKPNPRNAQKPRSANNTRNNEKNKNEALHNDKICKCNVDSLYSVNAHRVETDGLLSVSNDKMVAANSLIIDNQKAEISSILSAGNRNPGTVSSCHANICKAVDLSSFHKVGTQYADMR